MWVLSSATKRQPILERYCDIVTVAFPSVTISGMNGTVYMLEA